MIIAFWIYTFIYIAIGFIAGNYINVLIRVPDRYVSGMAIALTLGEITMAILAVLSIFAIK